MSRKIHGRMIYNIMHSRIEQFISRVPSGRIMNRFSNDLEKIDQDILYHIDFSLYKTSEVGVSIFFFGYMLGYETAGCVICMIACCLVLQRIYMGARREILRLMAISRSPIISVV